MLRRLLEFFGLGISANEATISGHRTPMGYLQVTGMSSATKLTVPSGLGTGFVPGYAIIQCAGAAGTDYVSWRDDGTAPDATHGLRLFSGQELDYSGDLANIQFINGSGTPALNVSFYS
jgi:hypothetical protein